MRLWNQEGNADHENDDYETNPQGEITEAKEFKRKKAQGNIDNENNQKGQKIPNTLDGFICKSTGSRRGISIHHIILLSLLIKRRLAIASLQDRLKLTGV